MRILVLSNYYPPLSVGGYEIACETTVNWLRARGHSVRVLTSRWRAAETEAEADLLRIYEQIDYSAGGYRQKWRVERENARLTRQAIDDWQPDVVYIWSLRMVSLGPLYAVQAAHCPRVFEMGDFWPDAYLKPGLGPWLRRSVKQHLPGLLGGPLRLDPVIAVARWMVPEIQAKYGSREIHAIPNGIPQPEEGLPGPRSDWQGPLRALFVGRLDPEKGLHLAIEALAGLKQQGLHLHLSVAGQGDADYTDFCRREVARHGLGDQVDFLGWRHDTDTLYRSHQLLLMPTVMREPFGLVILEALQYGLAVFASAAYGPAEILQAGQTGYLFAPGQSQALQAQLAAALHNRAHLAAIAAAGQQRAQQDYALDRVKADVERVLQAEAGGRTCLSA
ncbi:MAG: glycosyltransferase family 4 protein [Candidatus Sericytochromatia bacterium]